MVIYCNDYSSNSLAFESSNPNLSWKIFFFLIPLIVFVLSCFVGRLVDPLLRKGGEVRRGPRETHQPPSLEELTVMAWLGLLLLVVLLISNVIYCNLFFSFLVNCNIRLVAAFPLPRVRSDIWHQLWTPFPHRPNQSSLCPFHVLFVCFLCLLCLCLFATRLGQPIDLAILSLSPRHALLHTCTHHTLPLCPCVFIFLVHSYQLWNKI